MNKLKTVLKVLSALILIFILALIAIPYFYKDEIVQGIKDAANDEIDAELDFSDVSLSLIRHFPNLLVDIKDLSLTGKGEFEGLTLYTAENTLIDLDLQSLWDKSRIGTARRIELLKPVVQIAIKSDGQSNYDIIKPSDPTINEDEEGVFMMDLSSFKIEEGQFLYTDQSANATVQFERINLDGNAVLRGQTYDIDYQGDIQSTNLKASGINYLNEVQTQVDGGVLLDLNQSKYEFKETSLVLNDLDLGVDGFIQNQEASILMDVNFKSKDDSFKKLWSLVPAAYTEDFNSAVITGIMGVEGYVRGTYNASKAQLPSFDIKIKSNNGSISYPQMPKKLTGIFADINISSPGSLDQLYISIPQFRFNLDDSPFQGRFDVKNAQSNPDIDMALNGSINLGDIKELMPLEDVDELSGMITTDIQVKGKMSDLNNGAYQNTLISGLASLKDLKIKQTGQPLVQLDMLNATFSPQSVNIKDVTGRMGSTRFNTDIKIENVIALLTPGQEVSGSINWKSDLLDLNQWLVDPPEDANTMNTTASPGFNEYLPQNFQLRVNATSDMVKYENYEARDVVVQGLMKNGDLDIERMSTIIETSDIAISGKLSNTLGFLLADEVLTGNMKLSSRYLDLNQFMTVEDESLAKNTSNTDDLAPLTIPSNIKIDIDTDIDRLTYDNIEIQNIQGEVKVADSQVRMNDVNAQAFDGQFKLNGGYIAKVGETPKFDLDYTLSKFDFRKTFEKINTFQILAPIGKYINGNFNSTLKMSGDLTKDLLPNFKTLNANGFVETFNGLVAGFKPLELIGQYFKEETVKRMSLEDTRNSFMVQDGIVTVREFEKNIKDISLKISGTHALDQEINYLVKAKIPKEKLADTGVTDLVDKGLSSINTQLSKLGFKVNEGKYINLNFVVTGTITAPKLDVRVVGMDGETDITDVAKNEIKAATKAVKDSVTNRANAEIDSITAKANKKRDQLIDTASALVNQKVDSLKADVKNEVSKVIKDQIGGVVPDSLQSKIDSILLKGGGKEVEKVKEVLKNWNPFKPKPKKKPIGG